MKEPFVFQADSDLILNHYNTHPNYLIEYNHDVPKEYCILYFSSNNIYFPNTEVAFTNAILKSNRFELYKNRIKKGHKHIFFRDIKKQWYFTGINSEINNPQKLLEFIKAETAGYKVIVVGSSAGAYISVILGQQLGAERIYSLNGHFELLTKLKNEIAPVKTPILYRNRNNPDLTRYYDTLNFIRDPQTIFYFHSTRSALDMPQLKYIQKTNINIIKFNTSNHGIPFIKNNLTTVLNLPLPELLKLKNRELHPLLFSLKIVGFRKTFDGIYLIVNHLFNKYLFNKA